MSNLTAWIKFDSEAEGIRATGLLAREGESYAGVRTGIWVSQNAVRVFREEKVKFTILHDLTKTPAPLRKRAAHHRP